MSKGGLGGFFALVDSLFMVGMLLSLVIGGLAVGVSTISRAIHIPGVSDLQEQHAAMALWPATGGKLFELRVDEQSSGRAHGSLYSPRVKYRYTVEGKDYVGSDISMKPEAYAADNLDVFERRMRVLVPTFDRQPYVKSGACKALESYGTCSVAYPPLAQKIQVHYDPLHPERSILNNLDYDPPSFVERHFGTIIGVSFGVMTIAGLVFGFRRLRLANAEGVALTAAQRATDALADNAEHFRYAPASVPGYLASVAFGLVLFMFCVGFFPQLEWWKEMEHSLALFLLFALVITPAGVVGAGLALMPYTRTVIDFSRKTVVRTRWFLLMIPIRRRWTFSEFR